MKIIYYYQTLIGLKSVLKDPEVVDVIIVSSIHFGNNPDGTPYIHLNDHDPTDPIFDELWIETKQAGGLGVKIMMMLGGAGGAYSYLFSNFATYYPLLKATLEAHSEVTGLDLDIEESVSLSDVKKLIRQLKTDFGETFTLTMAPVLSSLTDDQPGMGGFVYKDLYQAPEGAQLSWFNVQDYWNYDVTDFDAMVKNGYPEDKLVLGMISRQAPTMKDFQKILNVVTALRDKYADFGGVFDWEYFDAPPGRDPIKWAQLMSQTY